ncbi:MAG: hypothetical protein KDC00_02800 [Flavobacteriales bacterium]|nr:hypothetical protein [Flavobacteriales bacterium]
MGALALAQQNDIPLQRDFYIDVERNAAAIDSKVHSGLKPVIESRADLTNVMGHRPDSSKYYYWITAKLFKEHFVEVKGEDYRLTLDPVFQFEFGDELHGNTQYDDTNRYYHNTRGLLITGDIGSKISFRTMFHENQAIVPEYLFTQALENGVVSGQGRIKIQERRILDYGWSQANVSYSPAKWLNVQFGHGKHFVGHGYRSVLLSDHAIVAPYLKFSLLSNNERFQYSTWSSKLQSGVLASDRLPTGESAESLFYWKRGRFNHFSVNLGRVQLGLFESTIFKDIDSTGVLPFDALELNPLIGVNTIVRGFDGPEKSVVGVDLRVKITDKGYLYGQFASDDPSAQRYAYQAGVRWFDVVREDLHVQLEYNSVDPFTYMNAPAKMAYEHAGLPLAHPLQANFTELVAIVEAGFGRFMGQVKVVLADRVRDPSVEANYGWDLKKPDRLVEAAEGPDSQTLTYGDVNVSYLFNPHTNLRAVVGAQRRSVDPGPEREQSTYIYVAIRTSLFNRYYDL